MARFLCLQVSPQTLCGIFSGCPSNTSRGVPCSCPCLCEGTLVSGVRGWRQAGVLLGLQCRNSKHMGRSKVFPLPPPSQPPPIASYWKDPTGEDKQLIAWDSGGFGTRKPGLDHQHPFPPKYFQCLLDLTRLEETLRTIFLSLRLPQLVPYSWGMLRRPGPGSYPSFSSSISRILP